MSRKLVSATGKPIVLRPVRPNAGIAAAYQAKLESKIDDMHRSLMYWLRAELRPVLAADDGSGWRAPSALAQLRAAMNKLAKRWLKQFDDAAEQMADWFANRAAGASEVQLRNILRDAGFTVQFKMSAPARQAMGAIVSENVSLIKSVAQQHLTRVEGAVMRSVAMGRDLGSLSKDLQETYGVTRKRAAFIALDQSNKATAAITRMRQKELGLNQAIWKHSHAGKEPRPEHVAADGKVYDVDKGMFLEGEWVWPGTAIRCRCVSAAVIPGFTP